MCGRGVARLTMANKDSRAAIFSPVMTNAAGALLYVFVYAFFRFHGFVTATLTS